jgi:DNA polymerase-1
MMKPPEFMTRWCGREPIFRTDLADMGHAWASV